MKKLYIAILFAVFFSNSFIFAGCFSCNNSFESLYIKARKRLLNKAIKIIKILQQKNLQLIENFIKNRIKKRKIYDLEMLFNLLLGDLFWERFNFPNKLPEVFINQTVQLLLKYKINLSIKNTEYTEEDWLYRLTKSDNLHLIIFLMKNCSDIDFSKFSILNFIDSIGTDRVNLGEVPEVLNILINSGVDLNEQHEIHNRSSALIMAAKYHTPKIFSFLLNEGANMNLQDDKGMTALMHAVDYDRPEIVYLLLMHDADINIKDNAGKTFRDYACKHKLFYDHNDRTCHNLRQMTEYELINIIERVKQYKIARWKIIDGTISVNNGFNESMPDELIDEINEY